MRQALASAAALLIGFALLQMGNALQGTLLSLRGQWEGFPAFGVGAIMSGFFLGMGVGSLIVPALIRRAGHLRAFAAFAALASAAALAHLLFIDMLAWFVIRAFSGLCFAGLLMVVESWLNASVASRQRGGLLAVYAAVGLGAGAAGQLQISIAPPESHVLFAVVSMTLSLALVPVSLSRATSPVEQTPDSKLDITAVLRASPFGVVAMLFVGMSIGCFFALAPVFVESRGMSTAQLGLFMALATGSAMLFQWPLGRLSDRFSRRGVASITASCAALVLLTLAFVPAGAHGTTLALAVLLGATIFPTQIIAAAQVNDRVEPRYVVAVAGTLVLVMATGAATGPILGGAMIDLVGMNGFIWALMTFQLSIAAMGAVRLLVRPGRAGGPDRTTAPAIFDPVAGALGRPESEAESQARAAEDAEAPPEAETGQGADAPCEPDPAR